MNERVRSDPVLQEMALWFQFDVDGQNTEVSGYVKCPPSLGGYHRRKSFPFGGGVFFVVEYISIYQQAEQSLLHHLLCCRKTYGLGHTL